MTQEKDKATENSMAEPIIKCFDEAYNMGVDACIQLTAQSYSILKAAMGDEAVEKFHHTYNTLIAHFQQLKKQTK